MEHQQQQQYMLTWFNLLITNNCDERYNEYSVRRILYVFSNPIFLLPHLFNYKLVRIKAAERSKNDVAHIQIMRKFLKETNWGRLKKQMKNLHIFGSKNVGVCDPDWPNVPPIRRAWIQGYELWSSSRPIQWWSNAFVHPSHFE